MESHTVGMMSRPGMMTVLLLLFKAGSHYIATTDLELTM